MSFFHDGMRKLQDKYHGREVADRIVDRRLQREFKEADQSVIENASFFFLATASKESVDCSFKGGSPGFIKVTGPSTLQWPDYDGNSMYRSLGNILENPLVGMLFLNFGTQIPTGSDARLRVNGRATIDDSLNAIEGLPGAQRLIRVEVESIFPNCPRYIPRMEQTDSSIYAPREGYTPPEPEWKKRSAFKTIFEKLNTKQD
jgi:uncharacterized protein